MRMMGSRRCREAWAGLAHTKRGEFEFAPQKGMIPGKPIVE